MKAATAQTEQDRKVARLGRMKTDQLVALACRCLDDKAKAEEEYELICSMLEERFPKERTEEEIVTAEGVAKRKVETTYLVVEGREKDLKSILGKDYATYIEEDTKYEIPKDRIADLRAHLGKAATKFVNEKPVYKVSAKLRARLRDANSDMSERLEGMVTTIPKTSVKVVPVAA